MPKLPGANRSRLVDEIIEYIREQIYSGQFPPGTQLRQERLSEDLDVSRTPLREALRVLQSDGLLVMKRGNRLEVVSADVDRFRDALVLREAVDGVAARLTAERQPPRLAARLERALDGQSRALEPWDRSAFSRYDAEFHREIFEASDNPFVAAQISLVRLSVQVFQRGSWWGEQRARGALEDHALIAESILAGDAQQAETVSREHIRRAIAELGQPQMSTSQSG